MNLFEQIAKIFKAMPLSRKLMMVIVIGLLGFGLTSVYKYGQKAQYQPLFGNLSTDDASLIADRLREQRIPFQIEGGGSLILVPSDKVYDIRLSLAGMGLPKGGTVGYEIFDDTDFGTTEFVQKLNYQRALQGELARTIKDFHEVINARVMIVLSKDSVFIEESKPPSASVLLKLRSKLSKSKVAAVVNLVASAIEDLTPDLVSVVDTDGNVLSKKSSESDKTDNMADSQLEYKLGFEGNLAKRIQTMLERIVGPNKAIVRVAADMDFSQIDVSEEIFDPDVQVERSRQNVIETLDSSQGSANGVSSVNPTTTRGSTGRQAANSAEKSQKQNETVNYEINRTIRRTVKPLAEIKRVSVAAVLDGKYEIETDKNGTQTRKYVPRTQAEIDQFMRVVQKAMGYSADREDQVSVESFPFDAMNEMTMDGTPSVNYLAIVKRYAHFVGYGFLIIVAFVLLIKPLTKAIQDVSAQVEQAALTTNQVPQQPLITAEGQAALPSPGNMSDRERAAYLARQDVGKTADQLRGWLTEAS
jgi:flagellar M-ring protein FliF